MSAANICIALFAEIRGKTRFCCLFTHSSSNWLNILLGCSLPKSGTRVCFSLPHPPWSLHEITCYCLTCWCAIYHQNTSLQNAIESSKAWQDETGRGALRKARPDRREGGSSVWERLRFWQEGFTQLWQIFFFFFAGSTRPRNITSLQNLCCIMQR